MGKITLDKEKCKGCGLCVSVCPKNLLKVNEKIEFKDDNTCIGCGMCAKSCPDFVIIEVYR